MKINENKLNENTEYNTELELVLKYFVVEILEISHHLKYHILSK